MKRISFKTEYLFLAMVMSLPFLDFPALKIGCTIQMSYVFSVLTLVFALRRREILPFSPESLVTPVTAPLVIFLIFVFLSIFQSRFIPPGQIYTYFFIHKPWIRSIVQFIALLFMIVPFFLTINFIRTKDMLYRVVTIWMFANFLVSLYGLYGFLSSYTVNLPFTDFAIATGYGDFLINRVKSVGIEPLIFGLSLVVPLPLGVSVAVVRKKHWILLLIIPQLLALILTFSRGAWLAFLSVALILLFLFREQIISNKRKVFLSSVLFCLVFEFLFMFLFARSGVTYVVNRFLYSLSGKSDYSSLMRFETWITAFRIFKAHFIFGGGIGNFWFYYKKYSPRLMDDWWINLGAIPATINNIFFSFLAETGIFGFAALVYFFFVLFKTVASCARKTRDEELRIILSGVLASLVAIIVGYQFISTFYFIFVWVMFGMAMAVVKLSCENTAASCVR